MQNHTKDKERFDSLLDDYATAVYLSNQLIESGLFEGRIKIRNNDSKRTEEVGRILTPSLASDLRRARAKIKGLKNPNVNQGEFFGSSLDIVNAYFDELASRGVGWEYADLEDLFIKYRSEAEVAMRLEH